jgi:hypothetical protein
MGIPSANLLLLLDEVADGLLQDRVGKGLRGRDLVHGDLNQHLVIRAVSLGTSVLLGNAVAATVIENL